MLSISMTEISVSWEASHYRDPAGFRPRVEGGLTGSPAVFGDLVVLNAAADPLAQPYTDC